MVKGLRPWALEAVNLSANPSTTLGEFLNLPLPQFPHLEKGKGRVTLHKRTEQEPPGASPSTEATIELDKSNWHQLSCNSGT